VLEFNYPTIIGLHVCDVPFTVFGMVDNLLPISGKLFLPLAVPFRFILPPRIAKATPSMSPVPSVDFSAPCNHVPSAAGTLA
jgi:hypothetical protein